MKKINILGLCLLLISISIQAENPVLKGFADPHMKVWNGRMYLSVGKDEDPSFTSFSMPYWCIYSSDDLINWTKEVQINPGDTYLGSASKACWATDINTRNGLYNFYFSNGGSNTGVLRATKPNGPYLDILNKTPLLPGSLTYNFEYDPTSFNDDDGKSYIIFGRDGQLTGSGYFHYQIAKMNEDMISLAERPRDLINSSLNGFGAANVARDHQYFHKNNGIYYLSCAGAYESSTNIYGPYSNRRNTGQNQGHSSFCEYNGQWYHAWEFTCDPFANRNYRQVMITYLHYKDNGDMVDDLNFIEGGKYYDYGVGNYNADWPQIEAEWYFKRVGTLVKKECPAGGFEMQNIQNNDCLFFPKIRNLTVNSVINFQVSSIKAGAKIEIYRDSPDGVLLGTCSVPVTSSWSTYKTISCNITNAADSDNICFKFVGGTGELLRLDWFNINKQTSSAINELNNSNFSITPIPAKDIVNIKLNSFFSTVSIFNSVGEKVYSISGVQNELIIPSREIGGIGVYFVKVNNSTLKLIINN